MIQGAEGGRVLLSGRISDDEVRIGSVNSGRRSLIDDFAAETAGAGAEVDEVVGGCNGVLVVLDDDEGIAVVTEVRKGLEEGGVVTRMEADRGLVEHVEHAAEIGPELGGEADALGLTAGKGVARAVELEIAEADFGEVAEAGVDFG